MVAGLNAEEAGRRGRAGLSAEVAKEVMKGGLRVQHIGAGHDCSPRPLPLGVFASSAKPASSAFGCPSLPPMPTVPNLIEQSAARLDAAGVGYGHGTTNGFDEAVGAVAAEAAVWTRWPNARSSPGAQAQVDALVDELTASRKPAAYLTKEAWLRGRRSTTTCDRAAQPHRRADRRWRSIDPWPSDRTQAVLTCAPATAAWRCSPPWHGRKWGRRRHLAARAGSRGDQRRAAWPRRAHHAARERWPGHLPGPYDLILCNLPYVNAQSMRGALPAEYRAEPESLAGGDDGMDFVRRLSSPTRRPAWAPTPCWCWRSARARAFRGRFSVAGGRLARHQCGRRAGAAVMRAAAAMAPP